MQSTVISRITTVKWKKNHSSKMENVKCEKYMSNARGGPGYDQRNRKRFRRCLKTESDGANVK